MYYEDKYLSSQTNYKKKLYLILQYLLYQYKNKIKIDEISIIKSLKFCGNGMDLFNRRDYIYFRDVIPYDKFENSLPTGYYVYTFSLYPLEDQPSGHQNFTNFDNTTIEVLANTNEAYSIDLMVKEYNILRIMSGLGSLAWLD
jgi:hypothetical protein